MSDSFDGLLELLPIASALQQSDNPLRIVLDRTVGEWLDEFEQPFEQLFLTSATGGWLDAHGRDYGVPRKIDEDDEHYRQRIIYEKLDHLTPSLLSDVYGVRLFTYRVDFDVKSNTLVSDNAWRRGAGECVSPRSGRPASPRVLPSARPQSEQGKGLWRRSACGS